MRAAMRAVNTEITLDREFGGDSASSCLLHGRTYKQTHTHTHTHRERERERERGARQGGFTAHQLNCTEQVDPVTRRNAFIGHARQRHDLIGCSATSSAGSGRVYFLTAVLLKCVASRPVIG